MISVSGGARIRCARFAASGTETLLEHAVKALQGRLACLLDRGGMLAIGPSRSMQAREG